MKIKEAGGLGGLDPSHCPKPGKTERSLRSYPSRYPPRRWRPVTGKIQTPRIRPEPEDLTEGNEDNGEANESRNPMDRQKIVLTVYV
jgi:hypothetical protein